MLLGLGSNVLALPPILLLPEVTLSGVPMSRDHPAVLSTQIMDPNNVICINEAHVPYL